MHLLLKIGKHAARFTCSTSFVLLMTGLCIMTDVQAQKDAPGIAPAPGWIKRIEPDGKAALPVDQASQGVHYLLSDQQVRIDAQGKTVYRHMATKALNGKGVESIAHIELGFNPAYEKLILHSINVWRAGKSTSRLGTAEIKVLQREKDLEYLVFDGRKTANIFLDDIRTDDIVEYAYSLRGANPVFANRQFGWFDLQWRVPVQHAHARLLWPKGREITFANHNTDQKPAITDLGDALEYTWEKKNTPALLMEAHAPGWYDPYAAIQWSEFKDWQAVVQWALPLYQTPADLSPRLHNEVGNIAKASADPGERLLSVLQLVQREVRYLGVEIGVSSHAPSSPDLVLKRRFGDCKDKTLLTLTLLRALGIEARPALVNTNLQRGVRDLHPSPNAFNHVIVHANLNGKDYWLDPTLPLQKGKLDNVSQPDFGFALVVEPGSRALLAMAPAADRSASRTVRTVIDARDGFDKPARYTITTQLKGVSAESMRGQLAGTNSEDLQKKYINYFAHYYPDITVTAPLSITENEQANQLTITEYYLVSNFWKRADAKKRLEATIYVPEVEDYLKKPEESIRKAPLALRHPVELTHTTEVLLPEEWPVEPEQIKINDPAFEFERKIERGDKKLILTDHFRSRADHVAASQTAQYTANLERVRENITYALYKHDQPAESAQSGLDRFNWPVAMVALFMLAVYIWLAMKLYRYDPPASEVLVDKELQGLRGWLILVMIGVVAFPVMTLKFLIDTGPSFALDVWTNLTVAGNAGYHPLWAPALLFELSANLALLVFSTLLVILFFQKRRNVPRIYIGISVLGICISLGDLLLTSNIPAAAEFGNDEWRELGKSIFRLLVWGSYFLVSRRVKSTFIHGWQEQKPVSPVSESVE